MMISIIKIGYKKMADGISAQVDFNNTDILRMPKGFSTCYVCHKKYGSKSISFHEPQCLQRWRNENNKLPASQRSSTPKRSSTANSSSDKPQEADKRLNQREKTIIITPRPQTATLNQPKVLDPNFAHHVDMTKQSRRTNRSQTFYLISPTPNLTIPDINLSHKTASSEQSQNTPVLKKKSEYSSDSTKKSSKNDSSFLESLPEPCQSCAKGNHSERFHSHPSISLRNNRELNISQVNKKLSQNGAKKSERNYQNIFSYHRWMDFEQKRNNHLSGANEVLQESRRNNPQGAELKDLNKESDFRKQKCSICGCSSPSIHKEHLQRQNKIQQLPRSAEINGRQNLPQNESSSYMVVCLECCEYLQKENSKDRRSTDQGAINKQLKHESQMQEAAEMSSRSSTLQAHRRFATCYICGREFGSKSIVIHERQCLKKWQIENEKLPKRHRRPEPQKPEKSFNDDGTLNLEAVADAAWKSHLEQLVPCPKCKRTFNPDRLIIHEKVCVEK